jgi:uncharacterized protein YcbK (DUF882 family)
MNQEGFMTNFKPARAATRQLRSFLLAAGIVGASAVVAFATPSIEVLRIGPDQPIIDIVSTRPTAEDRDQRTRREPPLLLGEADGVVPEGVTVFDDAFPAVANLDPSLLAALRQAAADASEDGVTFYVTSGWRSPEYQEQLLREAVLEYGSEEEAAKWVATAETSAHVSGDAVDIGPDDAMAWLSDQGDGYGLCQIYRNEPWHFELRPEAITDGCPLMYDDPTDDPRLQR